jgi:hypothetical protein
MAEWPAMKKVFANKFAEKTRDEWSATLVSCCVVLWSVSYRLVVYCC